MPGAPGCAGHARLRDGAAVVRRTACTAGASHQPRHASTRLARGTCGNSPFRTKYKKRTRVPRRGTLVPSPSGEGTQGRHFVRTSAVTIAGAGGAPPSVRVNVAVRPGATPKRA